MSNKQICEHCNNEFINLNSLKSHQRKSKYCLKIQNKEFTCDSCNKIFHIYKDFLKHKNDCLKIKELEEENRDIIYYQSENENLKQKIIDIEKDKKELKEQIKHLQDQLISKSTTTNNTTINTTNKFVNVSVINLNDENIKNLIENNYNIDVIIEGQKGIAKFAKKYILTDENGDPNYICTDRSRKVFKYKNNLGEIEIDVNAQKLTNKIIENGLINKTVNISQQYWTNDDNTIDNDKLHSILQQTNEINNIKYNNSVFKNELANITNS
jgi:hypothetical protein